MVPGNIVANSYVATLPACQCEMSVCLEFLVLLLGKYEKTIPKYESLPESLAELIVNSISINSGYTSILREVAGSSLLDQVIVLQR